MVIRSHDSDSHRQSQHRPIATTVEVFADITCPFTHVGLPRVAARLAEADSFIVLQVRAWPLEWVNGSPLEPGPVADKAAVLRADLGTEQFSGLDVNSWPTTTIPALNLAAAAFDISPELGLIVSRELRDALFEDGHDVSNPIVLADIAARHGLPEPGTEPTQSVLDDYEEGQRRGVKGSPDFFIGNDEFFCPALDLARDQTGSLTAQFDVVGLDTFISQVIANPAASAPLGEPASDF